MTSRSTAAGRRSPTGDFLRSRRELAQPEQFGLVRGRRRVNGLRREEVALLADVSVDYYTRLEQGRERHPSAQVVAALGEALTLNPHELAYLQRLANVSVAAPASSARVVDVPVQHLLDQWDAHPAFVMTDALDILAANALGDALHLSFASADNLARMVFIDPEGRRFYDEWEDVAQITVANVRTAWGRTRGADPIARLVEDLLARSTDFSRLWALQDVAAKTSAIKVLNHPQVGRLTLRYHTLGGGGGEDQYLLLYSPEPGSPDVQHLQRLANTLTWETTASIAPS